MHTIWKFAAPMVLLASACAHPDAPRPPVRIDGVNTQHEWQALCRVWGPRGPADQARIQDTPSGAAIDLTTDGDNIAELRQRVRESFSPEKLQEGAAPMTAPGRAAAAGGGMDAVVVSDTELGVQIRFVAPSRSQIEDVRRQTRVHYVNLSRGGCR